MVSSMVQATEGLPNDKKKSSEKSDHFNRGKRKGKGTTVIL